MLIRIKIILLLSIAVFLFPEEIYGQDALAIIKKLDENALGESNTALMKMTIQREDWTRELKFKTWSKGTDYSLILLTEPSRDKGTAFLKRDKDIWNWQPSIDKIIRMPPSMMMQSWMGSDFSNDDLVKQSSIVVDYAHEIVDEELIDNILCYKIEMLPKEEAAVVWGKMVMWVAKEGIYQVRSEFYDEDDYLVNTIFSRDFKEIQNRIVPTKLIVQNGDDPSEKTLIEYIDLKFDEKMNDGFFTIQNMKRLRADDY